MSDPLPRSASRVQEALRAAGLEAAVRELPDSTRTAQEAAAAIGCTVAEIAKSVVFRRGDDGRAVVVVLRGVDRVDTNALELLVGAPVERADPEYVRASTGYAIGGVPPVGLPSGVAAVLDSALLAYPTVWAAAGTPRAVFAAVPGDLARAGGMTVAAVAAKA